MENGYKVKSCLLFSFIYHLENQQEATCYLEFNHVTFIPAEEMVICRLSLDDLKTSF